MKTTKLAIVLTSAILVLAGSSTGEAQGTVTFNDPWVNNGIGYFGARHFDGMSFQVVRVPPQAGDGIRHVGATGPAGYPQNGTPYVGFINTFGIPQFIVFSRTNGQTFGLVSVELADPVAPSLAPVGITFNGFKPDGSTVSQTFSVGGSGSSAFQPFQFNADFALGLTRVEIPSIAWAMDNPVWIPEPSTAALFFMGLLAWTAGRKRAR